MNADRVSTTLARADLCRFVAACFYEPSAALAEERVFTSMQAVAKQIDGELASRVAALEKAYAADDLQALLIDYARLFLGPATPLAPPYGSSWLTDDPAVMQESTLAVLALYAEGGFEPDDAIRDLPDHIAIELEFLYLLLHAESQAAPDGVGDQQMTATLKSQLLHQHLGLWVEKFAAAMTANAATDFYRQLAQLTALVIKRELALSAVQ